MHILLTGNETKIGSDYEEGVAIETDVKRDSFLAKSDVTKKKNEKKKLLSVCYVS